MKLPTLYKKTSNGKIEQWTIETYHYNKISGGQGWVISTEYGHFDGKLQVAQEIVKEGKNLGKKNETTAQQQAESQAKSEWTMKKSRKGYVEDLAKAEAGENSGAGGIRPMLAKKFEDDEKKLKYPVYAQPKLDGIRCIAVVSDDGVTLWSREQKRIVAIPKISDAVAALKLPSGTVLDGELYNHSLKDDFEKIVSCVRKQYEAPNEDQDLIEYHVYDLPRHPDMVGASFGDRTVKLKLTLPDKGPIKYVDTFLVADRAALIHYRTECQLNGYEGCMARNHSPYEEGKRSYGLQKLKEFLEDDFEVVGVEEGVGKMAGLAVFECKAANGNLFSVKMEGELEGLRKYLQDESTWKGKKLSVKYFALTNKNKVPRFPVGKCIRDYE